MPGCTQKSIGLVPCWAVALLLCLSSALSAQTVEALPGPYPATKPITRQDADCRASLKQYVLGLLCEHEDRLLEALKAYEEAARLDPQAARGLQGQVPLLWPWSAARTRSPPSHKVLELDPADHETWFVRARLAKSVGQFKEAQALKRGLESPGIKDRPDVAQQMYLDLGGMHETDDEFPQAIEAFTRAVKILDHPELLMEHGDIPREMIRGAGRRDA